MLRIIWHLARWLCLSILAVGLGTGLYLHFSARGALDGDYHYSRQVAELPHFSGGNGVALLDFSGFTFRIRVAGFEENPDAPTVILLHGFPVTSAMWLPIIDDLVRSGYRVVAPDQRGYSPGARPTSKGAYHVTELLADVLALADTLGLDRFHLVGHDWGAMVGWYVALTEPERLLSWSALAIPHPSAFAEAVRSDPDQQRRSRYIGLVSLPWLPETLMVRNDLERLRILGSPDWPEQSREYAGLFSEPGAATAALNWYRAMPGEGMGPMPSELDVRVPTLFIWGRNDEIVGPYSIKGQRKYFSDRFNELEIDAGHRLVKESPAQVSGALVAHFRRNP